MKHNNFCNKCKMNTNHITFKRVSPTGVHYNQTNCKRCGSCWASARTNALLKTFDSRKRRERKTKKSNEYYTKLLNGEIPITDTINGNTL